ncbi:MAG: CBS domain-containing protein [Burkholderiaceae bacterium]
MDIGYICQRGVVTIDRMCNLVDAAGMMRDHHVGALVVVDDATEKALVVGVVTDRDIVVGSLASGCDPASTQVGSLVTGQVFSVSEEMGVDDAIGVMRGAGVRRLLVTDGDQELVGVVSLDDLMDALASDLNGVVSVIRTGLKLEEEARPPLNGAMPRSLPLRAAYRAERSLG